MPILMPTDAEITETLRKELDDPAFTPMPGILRVTKRLISTAWKAERIQEMNDERNTPPLLQFAIPKAHLTDGFYYAGKCRNANVARWNADDQQFYHWREKFGRTFVETIEYWDVNGTFDGFIPLFDLGVDPPKAIPLPPQQETPDGQEGQK